MKVIFLCVWIFACFTCMFAIFFPEKILKGWQMIPKTKLGRLNFWILQWFGVRLARRGCILHDGTLEPIKWIWLKNIRPMSGWRTPCKRFVKFLPCRWQL